MNLRVNRAPIYISRHGESQHNVLGLIGGDSELSPQGVRYAKALAKFIEEEDESDMQHTHPSEPVFLACQRPHPRPLSPACAGSRARTRSS